MTKAERRRLERAEAEVARLRAENVRLVEVVNRQIHENVRLGLAVKEALGILEEVRDDAR